MNAAWIIPFVLLGGALQSAGAAMNGQLHRSLSNPWLASASRSGPLQAAVGGLVG